MGFNYQHASSQGVNAMSPRNQSVSNNRKFARSSEKGADFKLRKKSAAVFPEPEIRCTEAERQPASAEGLSEENNCVWLSSDCRSHSLLSFDTPQDVLDNQFSVLSLSGGHGAPLDIGRVVTAAFDGSKISPMEEASLLCGTNEDDNEELEEEEIVRWLQYSVQNEVNDHAVWSSECGESSWERSSCNDLSMFGNSSTSLSTHDGIPSYVQDIDGSDFSSLLDLEKEDSELLSDGEHGNIVAEATEFSSPSKSNINLQCGSSISSCKTPCRTEEAESLVKDFDIDDPLYWPLDQNSYSSPEFDNFLCISPRRDTNYIAFSGPSKSNSSEGRFHEKRDHQKCRKIDREGCRRRISFSSTPVSVSSINKSSAKTSRLSRSLTRSLAEYYPYTTNLKKLSINKQNDNADKIQSSQKLAAGDIHEFMVEGVPIEKLIGLNEFDGHEGCRSWKVAGHRVSVVPEREIRHPAPAVEILPSKIAHPYKYAGENVDLHGLNIFKGRYSVADIIGFSSSEMLCSKSDGSLKSWEGAVDLVNVLKHEIRDGQLSFRGKRILELGCGYGLPGIFACLKGASTMHFQDLNAETIRCTTIPYVLANLEHARDRQSCQQDGQLTPTRHQLTPDVHFYAGEWEELHSVLSVVQRDGFEPAARVSIGFSEEDFMDGYSSQDGSVIGHESSSRRSRKLSGSRAWERASETDTGDCGYDIILITEIPHSVNTLRKLYSLITKCLRPPYGVLYLAVKKNYVVSNGGARQLRALVDEEGVFGAHLVSELTDREIWKFFFK
ncbi:hypothetical protein J5N97_012641 [Dioscorea zingiberensis]|uniref:Uncharacterized protein n=1 Tax=Dioscorea zingiberensis TaxID=325984 RepID=A0A9D5CQP8_9LILI|nr:hypothetical protein J5N97_012641 [Dioscorea zingiberensis]